jgi:hypothetical protein
MLFRIVNLKLLLALLSSVLDHLIALFGILDTAPATIYLARRYYHAARVRFELTTVTLTECCAAIAPPGNMYSLYHIFYSTPGENRTPDTGGRNTVF